MKKRNLLTLTALCLSLGLAVTACQGPQGQQGEKGEKGADGKDGATPEIKDGYWWINGKNTGVKASGEDGSKVTIGENGHWYIDGVDTGVSASGTGEKGDKGDSGNTYQGIFVNYGVVTGGTIKQDKYFVQPGETFTLTFEPDSTKGYDIILELEINGEAVEVDPDAESLTITSSTLDMGWQVTKAVFSSVEAYEKNGVYDYYNSLASNDFGLGKVANGNTTASTANGTYSDSDKAVSKVADEEYAKVKKAVSALGKDATVKEKLAAADVAIASAKSAIDAKYAEVITAKKKLASSAIESLVSTNLTANAKIKSLVSKEAAESIVEDGQEAVEECETLEEICKVVGEYEVKTTSSTTTKSGLYTNLVSGQKQVIEKVKDALDNVTKSESLLNLSDDATATDVANYELLVEKMAEFGVEIDELPAEIAESYIDQALASREELETYDKAGKVGDYSYASGDYKLAVEAGAKLSTTISNLETKLYNAIVASYKAEINALPATLADTNLKTTINAKIDTVASTWNKTQKAKAAKNVGSELATFVGLKKDKNGKLSFNINNEVEWKTSDQNESANQSLVGAIESALSDKSVVTYDIINERVKNTLASYKATWDADLAAAKANDAYYADAMLVSKDKDSKLSSPKVASYELKAAGTSGTPAAVTVANPALTAFGSAAADKDDVKRNKDNTTSIYYSAQAQYEALVDGYGEGDSQVWTKAKENDYYNKSWETVIEAKTWAENHKDDVKESYGLFMTKLAEDLGSEVAQSVNSNNTYVTQNVVKKAFTDKVYGDDDKVAVNVKTLTETAKSAYGTGTLLDAYNGFISTFVDGKVKADTSFKTVSIDGKYGIFYKGTLSGDTSSILTQILNGTLTAEDVTSDKIAAKLETLYASEVLAYTQDTYTNFKAAVDQLAYSSTITSAQKKALLDNADLFSSMFDDSNSQFVLTEDLFDAIKSECVSDKSSSSVYALFVTKLGFSTDSFSKEFDKLTDTEKVVKYSILKADNFASSYYEALKVLSKIQ